MRKDSSQSAGAGLLVSLAAIVIIIAGMKAAEPILVPFLLSIFIGIISAPLLFWLKRFRIPTGIALLIVIAGVIGILTGIAAVIGTSLDDFTRQMPVYQARINEMMAGLFAWLEGKGLQIPTKELRGQLDPGAAMGLVTGLLAGLGAALKNVLLILLTVIFILLEASSFPQKLRAAFGPQTSFDHLNLFRENLNRYLAIKTTVSLITGLVIGVWLAILHVDFFLLWAFLAFLLNYIPTIGSIIAAVPAVLLAFIQLGTGPAILTAIGFVVVNVLMGNLIEPRFMGMSLGLSTLVVFLSLVFWGWVLGPVGMLLSVPLTMTVKIALDSNEETRWMAILLGSGASLKSAATTSKTPS